MIIGFKAADRQRREQRDEIFSELAAAGLRFASIKGFAIADICYGESWLREFNDLDLLIPESDIPLVDRVLTSLGYGHYEHQSTTRVGELLSASRIDGYSKELQHLAEYVRPGPLKVEKVDVHHRIFTVFDHVQPSTTALLDALLDQTRTAAALTVHLCYHTWWDANGVEQTIQDRALRIAQFADVERMIRRGVTSLDQVHAFASEIGCAGPVAFVLRVCRDLWGSIKIDDQAERLGLAFDRRFSDRWITRDSSQTLWEWEKDASDRMFNSGIPALAARLFFTRYVQGHLKRGDVLRWELRG